MQVSVQNGGSLDHAPNMVNMDALWITLGSEQQVDSNNETGIRGDDKRNADFIRSRIKGPIRL